MKKILTIALLLGIVAGCVLHGSTNIVHPDKFKTNADFAEHLSNSTVAMVYRDDGEHYYTIYCGGVWISNTMFLTAYHCAVAGTISPIRLFVLRLNGESVAPNEVVGGPIDFVTNKEMSADQKSEKRKIISANSARVIAVDEQRDIALVASVFDLTSHSFVTISKKNPRIGSFLHVLGHTYGEPYRYSNGSVAGYLSFKISDFTDYKNLYMETDAHVWKGNSGSGAYDSDGQLIGISSLVRANPPTGNSSLYVSAQEIRSFLRSTGVEF